MLKKWKYWEREKKKIIALQMYITTKDTIYQVLEILA